MNLIQLQQRAVEEILAAKTQGPRAMAYGQTLLNRQRRALTGIRHRYELSAAKLGFSFDQIVAQWRDVKDMAVLEAQAEEAA